MNYCTNFLIMKEVPQLGVFSSAQSVFMFPHSNDTQIAITFTDVNKCKKNT